MAERVNDVMFQLEQAAQIIMAPPNLVSTEQRRAAETVLMEFKASKSPYAACKFILENSKLDYVMFQAAGAIKEAVVREWSLLADDDVKSLRNYLLQYVTQRPELQGYVREQVLQAVAVIFKRGSLQTMQGADHEQLMSDVTGLIGTGNPSMQSLGCSILMALMNEYSTTTHSSSIGLSWEFHLTAKRTFETRDLKRVFQLCVQVLQQLESMTVAPSRDVIVLINKFLAITEQVLSWRFTAYNLPGRFALVMENSQSCALMPGPAWRDILMDPAIVQFFFRIHDKVRSNPELAHHTLQCLCQLASIRGTVFNNDEMKVAYLKNYLQCYIQLISREDIAECEVLGVATAISRLALFFPVAFFANMPEEIGKHLKVALTKLSCQFCRLAAQQQGATGDDDDSRHQEAFERLLDAWTVFMSHAQQFGAGHFVESATEIFNVYVQCHLASPDGTRPQIAADTVEELEEEDRVAYADQLMCIGLFGRHILHHALPLITRLLEERVQRLHVELQNTYRVSAASPGATVMTGGALENIHEDIHWLFLIAGFMLSEDHMWESPVIPAEVMEHSLSQTSRVDATATVKMLVTPEDLSNRENTDTVVRLIATVFSFCEMERQAVAAAMIQLLSPQVGSTAMWLLRRWTIVYLMPDESNYSRVSMALVQAFGRDSEAGRWVIKFLLNKIISNLAVWTSELSLTRDTVHLLVALVCQSERASQVIRCEEIWSLAKQQASGAPPISLLPSASKRGLLKALVLAGTANKDADTKQQFLTQDADTKQQFLTQIVQPLRERFAVLTTREDFVKLCHTDAARAEVVHMLEAFCGIAEACHIQNIALLFPMLQPLLVESIPLVSIYRNYPNIVELVLDFYVSAARTSICYLSQSSAKKLYECAVNLIQTYAKNSTGRRALSKSEEEVEDTYRDILLVMQLLTQLLSKDFIDFAITVEEDEEQSEDAGTGVSAADIALYGLNIIMPLMDAELLRFPALCSQYYKLITFISEIYPEKICQLPSDLFRNLIASIDIALSSFGSDITHLCMEFLAMVATYVSSTQEPIPAHVRTMLQPFLKLVFDMLLHQHFDLDLTSSASITFFCLICCFQDEYRHLVEKLIAAQTDAAITQRLLEAFSALTPPQMALTPTRLNKIAFRRNFEKYMSNIKALLCIK